MSPQEKIAVRMCQDLCKKFRLLKSISPINKNRIVIGLVDGLMEITQPHPTHDLGLLPIRPDFDSSYEAGYDVGETWRRIAKDWVINTMDDPFFN